MNRAEKATEALRQQKERKQKKLLFILAPIFLLLLAWQGPGIVKQITNPPKPVGAAGTTTLASTAPTGTDPTGAAPTTAAGGQPVVAPANGGALPDTDNAVTPGEGQLVRFDRFLGKDPFFQQVKTQAPEAPPADNGPTITPAPDGTHNDGGNGQPTGYTSATVTTNGVEETLGKNATFPESEPIFRVTSIAKGSIKIGLVSGNFSAGQKTVTVKVGKTITLVSQPDGIRYVIKLVKTA